MFILWYSASSTFGKDSDIVMGVRAQQKEKTRRSLVEAAFSQLSAERSFASLSLREVAREAGIAPTSFYRHFRDVDELGLTMVDESGLMLRQLMRQARQRIAKGGSVIRTSVSTFMEFIGNNPNAFRLLLRERSGTSAAFRAAVAREIQHFIAELADYLELENHMPRACRSNGDNCLQCGCRGVGRRRRTTSAIRRATGTATANDFERGLLLVSP